ncbi:MAG: transposase, partial [Acidimicrobiales bacterium]
EAGKPRIQNPPDAVRDGEPLPACCTQQTVKVTLPPQIHKLSQRLYWGSKEWTRRYKQRTYVEGSYGNRKNNSTENLRRGLHRLTGMANVHLIMAMVNASYNLRMLNNWHERQAAKPGHRCDLCKDGLHPLLAEIIEPGAVVHLNSKEYADWEDFRATRTVA